MTRETLLSRAYAAAVAVFAVWLTWIAGTAHIPYYQKDELYVLLSLDRFSWSERVFIPYNGHILAVTFGLMAADYVWLKGLGHLSVGASVAFTWLAALVLWIGLRADGRFQGPSALTCFGLLVFVWFWSAGIYGLFWGFGVANTSTGLIFFCSVSCLLLACARLPSGAARGDPSKNVAAIRCWVLAASAAGFVCTFNFGSGASVWPALLAMAWLARMPWAYLAWLAGVGMGASGLYLLVLNSHPSLLLLPGFESQPHALLYALRLLGSLVGHSLHGLGVPVGLKLASVWAGGLGLGAALVATLPWRFREANTPGSVLLAAGLVTYAAVAALLTAEARVLLDSAAGTEPRMMIWSAVFWMGLVASLPAHLTRFAATRPIAASRVRVALPALAALISLGMLPAQLDSLVGQRFRVRVLEDAALALVSGVRSDQIYPRQVITSPGTARGAHDVMARDGRGPFGEPRAARMGRPVPPEFEAATVGRCMGGVVRVQQVPTDGAPAGRVFGTARDMLLGAPPETFLIVDQMGIVRGLGSAAPRGLALGPDSWRGYVAPLEQEQPYEVLAVLADRKFCSLGSLISGGSE